MSPPHPPPIPLAPLLPIGLLLLAGCTTFHPRPSRTPHPHSARVTFQAFPSCPPVPTADYPKHDQALLATFFALGGVHPPPEDILAAMPTHIPGRHPDSRRLQTLAAKQNRVLLLVPLSPQRLWHLLETRTPTLLRLPAQTPSNPPLPPAPNSNLRIPIAWDRSAHQLSLLRGDGHIDILPPPSLFAPSNNPSPRALCLINPEKRLPWLPSRMDHLLLAEYAENASQPRAARRHYDAVLKSTDLDSLAARAYAGLGRLALQQNNIDEAIRTLEIANAIDPNHPRILNTLAYLLAHQGGRPYSARPYAEAANLHDPGNPAILETLGTIELQIGHYKNAATYFERAWAMSNIHCSPAADQALIMDQLIRAYFANNQPNLARQVLAHRIRLHPTIPLPSDLPSPQN